MKIKLLLIDDCPELREILHWDIEENFPELEVSSTSNYYSAIEKLKSENIQIVISDYYLKGINGLELFNLFGHKTKFIIISGDAAVRSKLRSCDIVFLEKPFSQKALSIVLKNEVSKLNSFENSVHF